MRSVAPDSVLLCCLGHDRKQSPDPDRCPGDATSVALLRRESIVASAKPRPRLAGTSSHQPAAMAGTRIGVLAGSGRRAGACDPGRHGRGTGPVRSDGVYASEAVATAAAAASAVETAVETAQLAVQEAAAGKLFGRSLAQTLAEAASDAGDVQATFDAIQRPDRRSEKVHDVRLVQPGRDQAASGPAAGGGAARRPAGAWRPLWVRPRRRSGAVAAQGGIRLPGPRRTLPPLGPRPIHPGRAGADHWHGRRPPETRTARRGLPAPPTDRRVLEGP